MAHAVHGVRGVRGRGHAKIVMAMMTEFVPFQGAPMATLAAKTIDPYLHVQPVVALAQGRRRLLARYSVLE